MSVKLTEEEIDRLMEADSKADTWKSLIKMFEQILTERLNKQKNEIVKKLIL